MRTIWKKQLSWSDEQEISLPKAADLLEVQLQNDIPHLWAIVETDNPLELRKVYCRGTGHPMPEACGRQDFLGTVQAFGGLVFHFFKYPY